MKSLKRDPRMIEENVQFTWLGSMCELQKEKKRSLWESKTKEHTRFYTLLRFFRSNLVYFRS